MKMALKANNIIKKQPGSLNVSLFYSHFLTYPALSLSCTHPDFLGRVTSYDYGG
ncbi:protein of unknown function [Xenorhabdus nematophila AN6/1]|nr:protein of unknown function [Xenorhabdus nematophila AN6/1]